MSRMPQHRPGDHLVTDDRTGEVIWASDAREEWNGEVVHKDDYEERHPQDFKRAKADRQSVDNPRPEPVAVLVGPLSTTIAENALAGTGSITVASSVRFEVGDIIKIGLDNRTMHRATVIVIPDDSHLAFSPVLPWAASTDNVVVDESALPAIDIG